MPVTVRVGASTRTQGNSTRTHTLDVGDTLLIDGEKIEILSVSSSPPPSYEKKSVTFNKMPDPIEPMHYRSHPSGVECITVTEHFSFSLGNAVKYIWRHREKGGLEDLKKAQWYLNREIARLERLNEDAFSGE